MTEIKWEDTTSYRRGERYHAEPQSWEAQVGDIRISVSRHRNHQGWVLCCFTCGLVEHELGLVTAGAAKEAAIVILHSWLEAHCALLGGEE